MAADEAGNVAAARTHGDRVVWPWDGFFAPTAGGGVLNTARAGSAIPVTFSLGGARGLDVLADGYPRSVRIPCDSTADHDAIEQTATPVASALSYDAATGRYVYVRQMRVRARRRGSGATSRSRRTAGGCRTWRSRG